MKLRYLDTSTAILALTGNIPTMQWFDSTSPSGAIISSKLLQTEITRVLRRENRPIGDRDFILEKTLSIPLSENILQQAEAIKDHIKTLDAIHLASAMTLGAETVVVTHDHKMQKVAARLGLSTYDPVEYNT